MAAPIWSSILRLFFVHFRLAFTFGRWGFLLKHRLMNLLPYLRPDFMR